MGGGDTGDGQAEEGIDGEGGGGGEEGEGSSSSRWTTPTRSEVK